jgi:hypothetical protein
MAARASYSGLSAGRGRGSVGHLVLLVLCLAALVALPGCGGCRKTPQQLQAEREKKEAERRARELEKEKEKKPDLEFGRLVALPCDAATESCFYKPGHWTTTTLPAKANNFNLLGDLETTVVDGRGRRMELVGAHYTSAGSREVALPKGQAKLLQSVLYVPATGAKAFVSTQINARQGARGVYEKTHLNLVPMPSHQYHFVVLGRWPQSYKYLEGLDSVKHPSGAFLGEPSQGYYRVDLLRTEKRTLLPPHALFWTSIAYLLWDDAEATALAPEQRVALVDWLHWGGQLIVSGPDSLDALGNSFLAPYLPATSAGTRQLAAADFEELDDRWTRASGRKLAPVEPWAGVQFALAPEGRDVPGTGGLLGRGRIVVSAFDLDSPALANWPGFDGFFNACLLGRPPRKFIGDDQALETRVVWTDGGFAPFDPRVVSKLRYFTRDTGNKIGLRPPQEASRYGAGFGGGLTDVSGYGDAPSQLPAGTDVGSWSDFNGVANAARDALQNAARIEVPERMFVVWVLAVYLLVLVPANWIVFRSINRVEWAWIAAPLIAVVYTVIVIRLAQLDIGFARSTTEVAVVEMQGDYPRAHVTRYTALYTSLATTYEVRFDDPGAQVQPFPAGRSPDDVPSAAIRGTTHLRYRYGNDVRMRGLQVMSNTTEMVHSEQMADVGGAIVLAPAPGGGQQVTNGTAFSLEGVGVVRKSDSGEIETAWIGTLEAGQSVRLQFSPQPETNVAGQLWAGRRDRSPVTASAGEHGLSFRRLVDLAEDPSGLQAGDVRLVGWFQQEVPGLVVRPGSPQSRRAALVLAHLRYGFGKAPRPDVNTRRDVEGETQRVLGPGLPDLPQEQMP